LHGGSDGDTLIGEEGSDRIFGDSGDDILWGGNGNNTLTGGQGKDLFLIDVQSQQIITDFTQGQDVLVLTTGLTFEQLNFTLNNGALQIQNQGQTLAILTPNSYN
jgi:Ca2+-binding RTX toxin-like protein